MAKTIKKSVSFSKDTEPETLQRQQVEDIPILPKSWTNIPFHCIALISSMFKMGLTSNMDTILLKGFFTLIPIQIAYCFHLVSKFNYSDTSKSSASNTKKSKKVKRNNNNIVTLILAALVLSLLLSIPTFLALVLLGAPMSQLHAQTFLLALHLSLLIFFPLLIIYKFESSAWLKIVSLNTSIYSNQLLCTAIGTILGTWLGVFPIPLDWDRDWQAWPITLLTGGYIGCFVGGLVSCI